MKKLYDKNEVTFAVVMIVIYVVGSSITMSLTDSVTVNKACQAAFSVMLTGVFAVFVIKNGLSGRFGFRSSDIPARTMLCYIPLYFVAAASLPFGVGTELSAAGFACEMVIMLCSGFLEEFLFRGALYSGMAKTNEKRAVIVSSLTFGIGHIINLFNGKDIAETLWQIAYAVAVGFMLVLIYKYTRCMIHCMIFHSVNNICASVTTGKLLAGLTGSGDNSLLVVHIVKFAVIALYIAYLIRKVSKTAEQR